MDAVGAQRGLLSLASLALFACATGPQEAPTSPPSGALPSGGYTARDAGSLDAGGADSSDAARSPNDASGVALPLGAPCATDAQCSAGATGVERVCSTVSGTCIAACHSDSDCPSGETCDTTVWRCAHDAKSDAAPPPDAAPPAPIVAGYSPTASVAYAEAHWDDGVGECAQFVSDAAITAGGLAVGYTTWVPTLYAELESAAIPFDEYTPTQASVTACPGDIVIYSNGAGVDFCLPNDTTVPEQNCGHTGLVVIGGKDVASIEADFHNNAHQRLPLDGILTSTVVDRAAASYATLRVYHLSHCAFD